MDSQGGRTCVVGWAGSRSSSSQGVSPHPCPARHRLPLRRVRLRSASRRSRRAERCRTSRHPRAQRPRRWSVLRRPPLPTPRPRRDRRRNRLRRHHHDRRRPPGRPPSRPRNRPSWSLGCMASATPWACRPRSPPETMPGWRSVTGQDPSVRSRCTTRAVSRRLVWPPTSSLSKAIGYGHGGSRPLPDWGLRRSRRHARMGGSPSRAMAPSRSSLRPRNGPALSDPFDVRRTGQVWCCLTR
jgi:hypothetical protein